AYTFYRKALDFDPDHKGALEYLGELYVETGDLPKARENLARLEKLCPSGCEEREDLEKAIASAAASPQGVKATN
ncbi:MAG: tetratricopeptide repeat protein, partial [Hyphomicrobiales bacterium]